MNYLLFNKEILISDGQNVHRIGKGKDPKDILRSIEAANICVVDVDLLIAAAVEYPIEKKDSILVRKFNEFYQHEAYIIQDERIDNNLFQVIGIKEHKVRDIYSLIAPHNVKNLIPYGIALRNTLNNQKVDLNKTVVFVDDLGDERLLTVFNGLKFSRTRIITHSDEDILSEIKRSQIDFFKKTEEYLNTNSKDFIIVVNNQELANKISGNPGKLLVKYLSIQYPALEGLKDSNIQFQYRLPEDILRKRKDVDLKKNITTMVISAGVVLVSLFNLLFNRVELGVVNDQYRSARHAHERLVELVRILDRDTYRADLKAQEYLNYGVSYLALLEIIPTSYTVSTFKFYKTSKWNLELTLLANDKELLEPIPRIKILKGSEIKDIFVNDKPGKHLRITL
jgi:hypothetical protein